MCVLVRRVTGGDDIGGRNGASFPTFALDGCRFDVIYDRFTVCVFEREMMGKDQGGGGGDHV